LGCVFLRQQIDAIGIQITSQDDDRKYDYRIYRGQYPVIIGADENRGDKSDEGQMK
jgi:hypothetical protein